MGCNNDPRRQKTKGMFQYVTTRPPAILFEGKKWQSRSRLSHKQKMERPHSEGKQHQPQRSRTCSVHNKALQTKDNAGICTNDIIFRLRHQ